MRRSIAAGMWLILTVTATLIVWEAVGVVAADVTDRQAPVIALRQVAVALQTGTSTTTSVPTGVTVATASTVPSRVVPVVPGGPAPSVAPTTVAGGPPVVPTGPVFGSATTTSVPSTPPTTKAPTHPVVTTTTTAPVGGGTATFSSAGGVIAVACTSFDTIRLVAAVPEDSFQAVVLSSSGYFVYVNFVDQGRNLPVSAACIFGQPYQGNQNGYPTNFGG